jgi:DNA-binding NarL/FixJ family response regulator
MEKKKVSFLIISAYTSTNLAFKHIVENYFIGSSIDFAYSLKSGQERTNDRAYSLIVIDDVFPEMQTKDTIEVLARINPRASLLFYCDNLKKRQRLEYTELGINGILEKVASVETVVKAVNYLLEGKDFFDTAGLGFTYQAAEAEIFRAINMLSKRERQILQLLLTGLRQNDIAKKFGITSGAIAIQKGNMMRKLGVRNLLDLGQLAKKFEVEFH